ncbi:hypothetical protein [Mesorhizobium sp.]|uniref:hypothetical protein n=1 Tax=Mesorhizobium sp. TaxID=1871066 RepID=UPI00338F14B3
MTAEALNKAVPVDELRTKRDELQTSLHEIFRGAPFTDGKAYKKAQASLKDNEELMFPTRRLTPCFPPRCSGPSGQLNPITAASSRKLNGSYRCLCFDGGRSFSGPIVAVWGTSVAAKNLPFFQFAPTEKSGPKATSLRLADAEGGLTIRIAMVELKPFGDGFACIGVVVKCMPQ